MATATMHPVHHHKTGFERWEQTIDQALTNKAWDEYDDEIRRVVTEYNNFLGQTPGYKPLSCKTIKAMLWVESGGPSNAAWRSRPMQIGNPGDPGLKALLEGHEGGNLIIPDSLKNDLTVQTASHNPRMNIRAGVGYLLMRCAKFGRETTTEGWITDYQVAPHDTFEKIAHKLGSTVETLHKLNPGIRVLNPPQKIKFQKAKKHFGIVGWIPITNETIYRKYNVGDPRYPEKLAYCISIIEKSKRGPQ